MKIDIICVGKIKEKYFKDALHEYSKRLSRYLTVNITEVPDEKAPESLNASEQLIVKNKEGERIIKALKTSFTVALDIKGKKISSEDFADFFKNRMVFGTEDISFIIGGSLGLSDVVLKMADMRFSFSDMTFPHQLMRVILMEQIYRAFRIIRNEPYHK